MQSLGHKGASGERQVHAGSLSIPKVLAPKVIAHSECAGSVNGDPRMGHCAKKTFTHPFIQSSHKPLKILPLFPLSDEETEAQEVETWPPS